MTTEQQDTRPTGLALLRVPVPANQISKLPKESKAQADERKANRDSAINCAVCGGWHHRRAVHLDYVGHAALTDRLLDADPQWNWEPVSVDDRGLPALDKSGGLWIRLTVCGVTRLGYGDAEGKTGGAATKELIGDALRNAAMRFGAALDLWHKGDLHAHQNPDGDAGQEPPPPQTMPSDVLAEWLAAIAECKTVRGVNKALQQGTAAAGADAAALAEMKKAAAKRSVELAPNEAAAAAQHQTQETA
jgi:hypothetical protein